MVDNQVGYSVKMTRDSHLWELKHLFHRSFFFRQLADQLCTSLSTYFFFFFVIALSWIFIFSLIFFSQCSRGNFSLQVGHQITTLDYLLCLNFFAGRKFNSPHHHPTVPWVMDFSSRSSGWRDLTRTKFRLNKGDQQLDHTYQMAASQGEGKQAVRDINYSVLRIITVIVGFIEKATLLFHCHHAFVCL